MKKIKKYLWSFDGLFENVMSIKQASFYYKFAFVALSFDIIKCLYLKEFPRYTSNTNLAYGWIILSSICLLFYWPKSFNKRFLIGFVLAFFISSLRSTLVLLIVKIIFFIPQILLMKFSKLSLDQITYLDFSHFYLAVIYFYLQIINYFRSSFNK